MRDIVYFELNNWIENPNEEPFISWIGNDLDIKFMDEKWVKENRLCVVVSNIDMSLNFCITTTKKWVEKNCPKLLTDYKNFLRYPDDDGTIYGQFGDEFMKYDENHIGIIRQCF